MTLMAHLLPSDIIDLTGTVLRTRELKEKKLPEGFMTEVNVCYVTKNMEGVDIILSLDNNKVYFIQCTVSLSLVAEKVSFWETAPKNWKCILLTPYCAERVRTRIRDSRGALSTQFQDEKFCISDASQLLSAGEIDSVKGDMEF